MRTDGSVCGDWRWRRMRPSGGVVASNGRNTAGTWRPSVKTAPTAPRRRRLPCRPVWTGLSTWSWVLVSRRRPTCPRPPRPPSRPAGRSSAAPALCPAAWCCSTARKSPSTSRWRNVLHTNQPTAGHSGLVTWLWEDQGSNLATGSFVHHDSYCDIQLWAWTAHHYCSA